MSARTALPLLTLALLAARAGTATAAPGPGAEGYHFQVPTRVVYQSEWDWPQLDAPDSSIRQDPYLDMARGDVERLLAARAEMEEALAAAARSPLPEEPAEHEAFQELERRLAHFRTLADLACEGLLDAASDVERDHPGLGLRPAIPSGRGISHGLDEAARRVRHVYRRAATREPAGATTRDLTFVLLQARIRSIEEVAHGYVALLAAIGRRLRAARARAEGAGVP